MSIKDYNPFYKIIQPKQKELTNLEPSYNGLLPPKHEGGLQKLQEIKIEMIRKYLLETSVFRQQNDRIKLFDLKYNRTVPCEDAGFLLDELSKGLYLFFSDEKNKVEFPLSVYGDRIADSIKTLIECKEMFIAAGVEEKTFLQTMEKIDKWFSRVLKYIYKSIDPSNRAELVGILYYQYKKFSTLSDDGIYYNIAILFKHFGFEQGDINKIFQRIKRDYLRKGKPQKKSP